MHDPSDEFKTANLMNDERQLATYAKEVLSALGNRRFVLGFSFDGCMGRIFYFSRSCILPLASFHIICDFSTFAAIIIQVSCLNADQLGYEPNTIPFSLSCDEDTHLRDWVTVLPTVLGTPDKFSHALIINIIQIQRCIVGPGTLAGGIGFLTGEDGAESDSGKKMLKFLEKRKRTDEHYEKRPKGALIQADERN